MTVTLGIVLNETNAIRAKPDRRVGLVLLERTFYDPPRRAAMVRWTQQIRRSFPAATVVPYTWHLASHGPDDSTRQHATRTLAGEPGKIGSLQLNAETQPAWDVTEICREACEAQQIVVRTPPSLTPGMLGRRRLQKVAEAQQAKGVSLIWEPSGLWEATEALAFGREIGAKVIFPAFEGGRPSYVSEGSLDLVGFGAWLGVAPVGARQNLSGDQVDALVDHAEEHPDSVMIFSGRRALAGIRTVGEALEA